MDKKRDSFFLHNKKQKSTEKKDFTQKNKRQENFNKNRPGLEKEPEVRAEQEQREKKPFDKKTYRLKKYSKKYKLEQWEEQRKKKLLRNYYKEIKNDPDVGSYKPKTFDDDDEDEVDSGEVGKFVRHPDLIKDEVPNKPESNGNKAKLIKKDPFWKAKERYDKIKQEKIDKKQEIEKAKEEKNKKLMEYKKKKQERFKKLSKKTKKGQPVMTGRLELLLEKIQNNK